ncbi:MAG: hypothetical protein MJ058_02055 [Akkermansia sp.]|nr:hypothetical protein [Akkermansia sp.]
MGKTKETTMGLFDNVLGSLMGGKVGDILRADCPQEVLPALEKLLADSEAVKTITAYVQDCMAGAADLSVEEIMNLPFKQAVADVLKSNPQLADHLVATAKNKLGL